jgi:DNA polymerase II small subunit
MPQNILRLFIEKGFLLDKEMLDFFSRLEDEEVAQEIMDKIKIISGEKLITKNLINNNFDRIGQIFNELDKEKKQIVESFFVNVSVSVEVKKETRIEEVKETRASDVKVLFSPILQDKRLEVRDFVKHFRNRYAFFKKILSQKPELDNLTSIDKLSGNRDFSIIGMVTNKNITKNKNVILEVEDLTGKAKLLITKAKEEIFEKGKEIILDDIIGFKCSGSKDFLFVNDLFYPDIYLKEKKRTDEEVYALFISDSHVGSDNFLEDKFEKFLSWLNGQNCEGEYKELLAKIKYLFVVGDSIDGVGIYPGQEKFLHIKDIKKQYEKLAEFYKKIPSHISIIQCPGQHDAVRVAEPQPPIGADFGEPLTRIPNLYLVSNPSLIEIAQDYCKDGRGIKVLMYHGASMNGIINEIEELRLNNAHATPARAVKHLLLRRHLSPTHGASIYIPNQQEDPLIIKEVPDIIATGDLHKPDIDLYHNILIICSSCWQSTTAFEEKVGNLPDPCKVPLLNLKTREIKILDFS